MLLKKDQLRVKNVCQSSPFEWQQVSLLLNIIDVKLYKQYTLSVRRAVGSSYCVQTGSFRICLVL